MIRKFDTYSEMICLFIVWIVLLDIRNVSNFKTWGCGFWLESLKIVWKSTLIFMYVIE